MADYGPAKEGKWMLRLKDLYSDIEQFASEVRDVLGTHFGPPPLAERGSVDLT